MEHPSKREYPEEWELIQFFGQDCDPLDKDEAEFFGRSRFTMTLDDETFLRSRSTEASAISTSRSRPKKRRRSTSSHVMFGTQDRAAPRSRDDARGVRNGTARSTGAVEADTEAAVVLGLKARVIAHFLGQRPRMPP